MSRSGYSEDCDDDLLMGRWRGMVASATRGARGQKLFKDLAQALDEMPLKELIKNALETPDGSYCALGVLGKKRGINLNEIDPEDYDLVAKNFDIASPLAQEIVYMNDEYFCGKPSDRWKEMRAWVGKQIKSEDKS